MRGICITCCHVRHQVSCELEEVWCESLDQPNEPLHSPDTRLSPQERTSVSSQYSALVTTHSNMRLVICDMETAAVWFKENRSTSLKSSSKGTRAGGKVISLSQTRRGGDINQLPSTSIWFTDMRNQGVFLKFKATFTVLLWYKA